MFTRIIDPSELEWAAYALKRGETVAFPTETVYGLGALMFDKTAVANIFSIKGRPIDNPLIVHVALLEQALDLIDSPPPSFFLLARHFWPGPLTLVMKKKDHVPSIVSGGHPTIAIRMPSHPITVKLIEQVGMPLVAPSANLSGRPSPTCAEDVYEDLKGKIGLIVDGGNCPIGIESTVLSLVDQTPRLLRPGSIMQETLEKYLQLKIETPTSQTPIHSPGMKYRHYAPKATIRLVYDRKDLLGSYILSRVPQKGESLLSQKTLFSELRRADRLGVKLIEVYCDIETQLDRALMNRLEKASNLEGEIPCLMK